MVTLTRLISSCEWDAVETMLSLRPIEQIEIDETLKITDKSILHLALRHDAPLRSVELLALKYPLCLTTPDPTGKYACHVACEYGASPAVLEFLVLENAHAAGLQDPEGKAPIHYVGEFYASNYESPSSPAVRENMIQVINILQQAAPYSFNLEDADGCNAVEYAIANDADLVVIKTLQRTAKDDWEFMRTMGRGKTHDERERDVKLSADEARLKNVMLSDVIASSVSRRNLGLARPTKSEPDDSCFTIEGSVSESVAVPIFSSSHPAYDQGQSSFAKSA